jgi:hypothetical protein
MFDMEWSMWVMPEWQIAAALTVLSAMFGWLTRRRVFGTVAIGGLATLLIALALWDPIRVETFLVFIGFGSVLLIWMARRILEPMASE